MTAIKDEHFINLDSMHEYEWPKETEEEFREMFHRQLLERKQCHIWRGQLSCFCPNDGHRKGDAEDLRGGMVNGYKTI